MKWTSLHWKKPASEIVWVSLMGPLHQFPKTVYRLKRRYLQLELCKYFMQLINFSVCAPEFCIFYIMKWKDSPGPISASHVVNRSNMTYFNMFLLFVSLFCILHIYLFIELVIMNCRIKYLFLTLLLLYFLMLLLCIL